MTSRRENQKKKRGSVHNREGKRSKLGLFIIISTISLLFLAYLLHTDEKKDVWSAKLVNNTRDLTQALNNVQKECNVDTLTILTDDMMRVGIMLENKLANMENTELTYYTHRDILSAAEIYKVATFFLVKKLQTLFTTTPETTTNGTLLNNNINTNNNNINCDNSNNISVYTPALVWQWMAVASHALMAVLPEYYLAMDNTNAHGEVLVLGLELLQQVSNTSSSSIYSVNALNNTIRNDKKGLKLVVNCERYGKDASRWMKFCINSFNNHTSLDIRRAAILEELIALHPDYAPLRLHYTVTIALSPHVMKRDLVRKWIEREKSKLQSRSYIDPLHSVILQLCEAFVSPTQVIKRNLVEAIHKIESCAKLFRPFHINNEDSWKRRFEGKQRPDVMNGEEAKRLLNVIKNLLEESGEVFPDALITCGDI